MAVITLVWGRKVTKAILENWGLSVRATHRLRPATKGKSGTIRDVEPWLVVEVDPGPGAAEAVSKRWMKLGLKGRKQMRPWVRWRVGARLFSRRWWMLSVTNAKC